jgi:hypothetical protein
MKKITATYTASIEKTFEIPDELYDEIKNGNGCFDWVTMDELFEMAPDSLVDLHDLSCVEDFETEEIIYEY